MITIIKKRKMEYIENCLENRFTKIVFLCDIYI